MTLIIPDYLVNRWHKDREWHYCHENRNLYVHDDTGQEYIITQRGHFANKIVAKRHNENLLLGITDEQYNETQKASVVQKPELDIKQSRGFKRMGNKGHSPIRQRR